MTTESYKEDAVGGTFALSEDSGERAHTGRWPLAPRLLPLDVSWCHPCPRSVA